ncbi:MAG: HAMP domain-containing sensor histidine kinase [Sedimentibacter sp.]
MLVTKWKTYSRKKITKTSAFILFIICLLIGVSSALNIFLNVQDYESITVKSYMKSNTLSNELRYAANRLEHVLRVYKNEEYIRAGNTVNNINIEDSWQLTNLYNNYLAEKGYEDSAESKQLFMEEKSQEVKDIKEIIKKSDLSNYEQIINDLNNPEGLIYYATDGSYVCTNTENEDRNFYFIRNAYILIDKKGVIVEPENGYSTYSSSLIDTFEAIEDGDKETAIYAAITDEGLALRVDKWISDRHILITNSVIIAFCLIISAACFIYLLYVTGKITGDEEIHMVRFDKVYSDISMAVVIGIVALAILEFYNILNVRYTSENLMKLAMLSSAAALFSIFLMIFLSLARHIKNGTLIKHSLIYIILSKTISALIRIVNGGPLMLKSVAGIIALIAVSMYCAENPILTIPLAIVAVYFVYLKVKAFKTIQEGLFVAKKGEYDFKIQVRGNGEFKQLSEDINTITSGLKFAVQNEVKSEKLKSELITNVSHDIKTPLTSIISYVDLLKREGLQSPNAPKYLDVLDRKSRRLKTLTEDLFEAAKATSGSIEPNLEKVHVNALVSQILGELDEKIIESKLIFKVTAAKEKTYAIADGRLLSRVMENLISNIFKYAQNESRVYIDIYETEKEVFVCFKNVSAYELNIPVDELMERFKRGDESRSSEGSGLGLAIARSLMEIQNGILELSIDGDLFKAEIRLPRI